MRKTFKTMDEFLQHIRQFHSDLSDYYARLSNKAEKTRVKMLLGYISDHARDLEQNLEEYQEQAPGQVLDVWFQYLPELEKLEQSLRVELKPDMSVDDVVETATHFGDALLHMYEQVVERSQNEQVAEVFKQLLEKKKEEKKRLVKDVTMLKDV